LQAVPRPVPVIDVSVQLRGRLAFRVATDLPDYVFGVTIANDLSAREVQLPQGQFLKGKSYRAFCPTGPVLAVLEPQDFRLLDDLELRLDVDNTPRQRDNTANMVYRPAETLTELRRLLDHTATAQGAERQRSGHA